MTKPPEITYSLAMAAARDAGNRSMRAGGRTKWAVKDWNAACDEFARLWPSPGGENGDFSPQEPSEPSRGVRQ